MTNSKKDAKEILTYEIIRDVGLGEDIRLGMDEEEFLNIYNIEEYIASGECIHKYRKSPFGKERLYIDYTLFDESVDLVFDGIYHKLIAISVSNGFQGKYLKTIGIGTPFKEFYQLCADEMHFDDDLYFIGEGYKFQVELDFDECEERLEYVNPLYYKRGEVDTCKIERISLRKDIEEIVG